MQGKYFNTLIERYALVPMDGNNKRFSHTVHLKLAISEETILKEL
jgi:hypothetical protein